MRSGVQQDTFTVRGDHGIDILGNIFILVAVTHERAVAALPTLRIYIGCASMHLRMMWTCGHAACQKEGRQTSYRIESSEDVLPAPRSGGCN